MLRKSMKEIKRPQYNGQWPSNIKEHESFLRTVQEEFPEECDWIGIYYKASYLGENAPNLLQLGPYIGADTEHDRIPFDKGICGMSISQEKTINIPDVSASTEYLACSLETKSELVIPLSDQHGKIVAELDIDSHQTAAFSAEIEKAIKAMCEEAKACF
jgi:GAF domain-containing protein